MHVYIFIHACLYIYRCMFIYFKLRAVVTWLSVKCARAVGSPQDGSYLLLITDLHVLYSLEV